MRKTICLLSLACALAGYTFADESKDTAAIEEFFKAAKVREKYELGLSAGYDAGADAKDNPSWTEAQKKKVDSFRKKIKTVMMEEMGWDKVKDEYAKIYLSIYSIDELKKVTELLKSPAGQILISKELELLPKAMKMGRDKAKELMPKIMKMAAEETQE